MKKKIIIIVGIIIAITVVVSIDPIRTFYYNQKYSAQLQQLLKDGIKDYQYVQNITIKDIMKRKRYIALDMSTDFNSLTREEKYNYMKNDLGSEIHHIYTRWVNDNKIYDNKLWENVYGLHNEVSIVMNCESKTYKFGYYEDKTSEFGDKKNYVLFHNNYFVDYDGVVYEFVNDKEIRRYVEVTDKKTLSEVWAMAQLFIKDKLKSPSSAKFPTYGDDKVSITYSGDYYKITGYVDADNSFGAKIRSTFSLVLKRDDDKFTLKEIDIY